jgi:hypothetical protein
MGYFKLRQILNIGRRIHADARALVYDSAVVRHVYLGRLKRVEGDPDVTGNRP